MTCRAAALRVASFHPSTVNRIDLQGFCHRAPSLSVSARDLEVLGIYRDELLMPHAAGPLRCLSHCSGAGYLAQSSAS